MLMMRFLIMMVLCICAVKPLVAAAKSEFDDMYYRLRGYDSRTLDSIGRQCISRKSIDSAMAVFTILANRYDADSDHNDRKYAVEARLSLGVLNFLNANYPASYSNFLTATELEGRLDSPGHMNLASIYLYYGDQSRAYRCLRGVFDASLKSGNDYMASVAMINMLTSNLSENVLPKDTLRDVILSFQKNVRRTEKNTAWLLADCYARAKMHSFAGEHHKAINTMRSALSAADSMLIPQREHFAVYTVLGKKYLDINMPDSAEFFFKKAEEIAESNAFPELLISAYSELSRFYAATGRADLASKYKYRHLELNDSVFNAREFGHIHDLELFYETDKFEKQIGQIRFEERIRSRIMLASIIGLVVLSVLLALLFFQNRNLKIKNKSLFDKNREIMLSEDKGNGLPETSDRKSGRLVLGDEMRNRISESIREAMNDESVFCSEGFTIHELAELCGSNQKYVSQIVNEDYGKSFSQLLSECRINVARRRFMDFENYGHLTIEAIVESVGFKSRSTFSKSFKRATGLTPSEFQRIAAEEAKETKEAKEAEGSESGD